MALPYLGKEVPLAGKFRADVVISFKCVCARLSSARLSLAGFSWLSRPHPEGLMGTAGGPVLVFAQTAPGSLAGQPQWLKQMCLEKVK